jgi:hypothetical protein
MIDDADCAEVISTDLVSSNESLMDETLWHITMLMI